MTPHRPIPTADRTTSGSRTTTKAADDLIRWLRVERESWDLMGDAESNSIRRASYHARRDQLDFVMQGLERRLADVEVEAVTNAENWSARCEVALDSVPGPVLVLDTDHGPVEVAMG